MSHSGSKTRLTHLAQPGLTDVSRNVLAVMEARILGDMCGLCKDDWPNSAHLTCSKSMQCFVYREVLMRKPTLAAVKAIGVNMNLYEDEVEDGTC